MKTFLKHSSYNMLCMCYLILLFVALSMPLTAKAAQQVSGTLEVCSSAVFHPDAPNILTLSCAFFSQNDTITIYGDKPLDPAQSWQAQINDHSAEWVFDAGNNGNAELIVDFAMQQNHVNASFFDDQDGDKKVQYAVRNNRVVTQESQYPTVRVVGGKSWLTQHGVFDFNLDVYVDGPVLGAFQSEVYLSRMKNDGLIDIHSMVRDTNNNGLPDYEIIQATPPVPDEWGIYRTLIMVNPNDNEVPISNSVLWPLIGTVYGPVLNFNGGGLPTLPFKDSLGRTYGIVKDYGKSFPPIQMVWSEGRMGYVGEFVASRANDHNWFTYSIKRIDDTKVVNSNFEAPFAYYDLAADNDHFPELQVRNEYFFSSDVSFENGSLPFPTENIRYSWDQNNDNHFDYKVDLVGRYQTTDLVNLNEVAFITADPKNLPTWVISKPWDGAAFVAVEGRKLYNSTEGIYEYPATAIRRYYMQGATGNFHGAYETIRAGLRGEYRAESGMPATLYLSPIDNKLHLLNANAGVWQLDDITDGSATMRYANLRGQDYIDQWTYTHVITTGAVMTETRQLTVADPYMFYTDDNQLAMKQTSIQPFLFKTLPPTNHEEWQVLGAQLAAHKSMQKLDDVQTMFDQFVGAEVRISNASMRDYRADGTDGFRFILELRPGFQQTGPSLLPIDGLPAGDYVVAYHETFSIEPVVPAQLNVSIHLPTDSISQVTQPIALQANIVNGGREDAHNIILVVDAGTKAGSVRVQRVSVGTVLAGSTKQVPITWTPLQGGQITLRTALYGVNDTLLIEVRNNTSVYKANTHGEDIPKVLNNSSANVIFLLVLLSTIALITIFITRYLWYNESAERTHHVTE